LLGTPAAIAHLGSEDEDVQLETGEPLPGHLPDPLDLGVDQLARAGEAVSQLLAVGDLPGGDADDVGVAGCDPQHPAPPAPYEEGGPSRPGLGQAGMVHPVVVAVEVDRAVRPRLFQHHDRLLETVDLDPGRVLSYAGGGVVGLVPAGPDAELQPAAGQQ